MELYMKIFYDTHIHLEILFKELFKLLILVFRLISEALKILPVIPRLPLILRT